MLYSISNDLLDVAIETEGAELRSMRRRGDDTEYLWQGDPAFWGRRAPVLFPIVGRLRGDRYLFRGREYRLPQHGFARDAEFEVAGAARDHASFVMRSSEDSMAVYPFPFALGIRYGLEGCALVVTYEVANPGHDLLWFSLGAHPGFNCPTRGKASFEDYQILFEAEETTDRMSLEGGLIAEGRERILEGARNLPLDRGLFDRGALVFEGLRSRWAGLARRGEDPEVVVHFEGWPYLGIWTPPGAPFVCIEPWFGMADGVDFAGEITEKKGILSLVPGGRFETVLRIELPAI